MEKITCYKSKDGKIHTSLEAARRYTDRRYGDILQKLALDMGEIDGLGKYQERMLFIDANLNRFTDLADLKADCILQNDNDNEGE